MRVWAAKEVQFITVGKTKPVYLSLFLSSQSLIFGFNFLWNFGHESINLSPKSIVDESNLFTNQWMFWIDAGSIQAPNHKYLHGTLHVSEMHFLAKEHQSCSSVFILEVFDSKAFLEHCHMVKTVDHMFYAAIFCILTLEFGLRRSHVS